MKIPAGILAMTILLASCKEEPHAAPIDLVNEDPVKLDPTHYKVEFENDSVRVLRITYPAHEKSVMHHHPNSVAIYLTDGKSQFTLPDGKTQDGPMKAGAVQWTDAGKHLPENVGDKPFELILVELKTKKAAAK